MVSLCGSCGWPAGGFDWGSAVVFGITIRRVWRARVVVSLTSIYIYEPHDLRSGRSFKGLKLRMPHRLAVGAAGGTASTLLLTLAQGFLGTPGPFPLAEDLCTCPDLGWDFSLRDLHNQEIFFAGLLCGLLAGPLLDLAVLLRDRWRRLIFSCLTGGRAGRSFYRVLYE